MGRTENKINAFIKAIKNQQTLESSNEIVGIVHTNANSKEYIQNADLIINATPAGMYDKSVQNIKSIFPFGEIFWETLDAKTTLYDLIYNPRPTEWLKLGRKRGCDCIDGLEMLIQQGAASLTLWSGFQEIPIDIMRSAAIEYLIQ